MKRLPWLIVLALVLVGLILATGIAYAENLDRHPLAGFFRQGQIMVKEAQQPMTLDLRNTTEGDGDIEIIGTLISIDTGTLVVDTTVIAITPETIFKDAIEVGDMIKVEAYNAEDSTLTADKVELYDQNGYGYSLKVKVVGYVDSFTSDTIIVSGVIITVTEQTKIVGDIVVGDVVRVHAFVDEDGSLTAWKIKWLPDAVADPGNGDKVRVLGGVVESISSDSIVVSGITFMISPETVIVGDVDVDDYVDVKAYTAEDGSLTALRIVEVKGCWDGDTFVRGNDDKCEYGSDRDDPGNSDHDQDGDKNPHDKVLGKDKDKDKVKDNFKIDDKNKIKDDKDK